MIKKNCPPPPGPAVGTDECQAFLSQEKDKFKIWLTNSLRDRERGGTDLRSYVLGLRQQRMKLSLRRRGKGRHAFQYRRQVVVQRILLFFQQALERASCGTLLSKPRNYFLFHGKKM